MSPENIKDAYLKDFVKWNPNGNDYLLTFYIKIISKILLKFDLVNYFLTHPTHDQT